MEIEVGRAYSSRVMEYVDLCGAMTAVHPSDRQLIDSWAEAVTGPVLDAGCGPGHWTDYLARSGADASGIDLSPDFIAHARAHYPAVSFEVGDVDALSTTTASLGGLLAWYSLIHHEPSTIQVPLTEFARVLRPGGDLLFGFFEGSTIEPFDHAVLEAFKWPVAVLGRELCAAGFDVIETHRRTGAGERPRPHGAILARRRSYTSGCPR